MNEATWQPCGLTPDMTCLIVLSLPAASMAWKTSSSDQRFLGVKDVLLLREPFGSALEEFGRLAFIQLQTAGVARVEVLQLKALALGDAERVNVFLDALQNLFSRHDAASLRLATV